MGSYMAVISAGLCLGPITNSSTFQTFSFIDLVSFSIFVLLPTFCFFWFSTPSVISTVKMLFGFGLFNFSWVFLLFNIFLLCTLHLVLKGPDRQGGSECPRVVKGSLVFRATNWILMVHKWSILVLYDPYKAPGR